MTEARTSPTVSTRLLRIAEQARAAPDMALSNLAHHVDVALLAEAYRRTRKDGAVGIDGQTADAYAADLTSNLHSLWERLKSGDAYRAPPVRRVYIPKGNGRESRPIGIPTFEDKIAQRAYAMVLEAVYEQDFLPCSYGFRPGRSAHDAVQDLWDGVMRLGGGWVLDVDIQGFFDHLDHVHLREILAKRVRDRGIQRMVGKWLNAGVLEDGEVSRPAAGTPQGGVISPLLANIYLHEVLDTWFEGTVVPRLWGRAFLIRYADDFVMVFSDRGDALRVMEVLPKRLGKYGLTMHPDKTRLVPFRRPRREAGEAGEQRPGTFDFLGFTHHWGQSRRGRWIVKRRTAKSRVARTARALHQWLKRHRHWPLVEQRRVLGLKLRGHYGYYGITGNIEALERVYRRAVRAWRRWLSRRNQHREMTWDRMNRLLKRYPLPLPVVVQSIYRRAANAAP
jgi:RNA-directed DNA polymerase